MPHLMVFGLLVCAMMARGQPTHKDWPWSEDHTDDDEDWPTNEALYSIMGTDEGEARETKRAILGEIKALKTTMKKLKNSSKRLTSVIKKRRATAAECQRLEKMNLKKREEIKKLININLGLKGAVQALKQAQEAKASAALSEVTTDINLPSATENNPTTTGDQPTAINNQPTTVLYQPNCGLPSDMWLAGGRKTSGNLNDVISKVLVKGKTDMYELRGGISGMSVVNDMLWVPDWLNKVIHVLDPHTNNNPTQTVIPGITPYSVYQTGPTEVLLDANQGLYVLSTAGSVLYQVGGGRITDLSVDCDTATAYLYYYSSNHVVTVSYNGSRWVRTGSFRAGNSRWNTIEVVGGLIYLGSSSTDTIHTYTLRGSHLATHGSHGKSSPGQLDQPLLCGTDSQGALLVCDWYSHRLQVLSPGGGWEVYSLEGLRCPEAVTVDTSGNLWLLWYRSGSTHIVSKYSV